MFTDLQATEKLKITLARLLTQDHHCVSGNCSSFVPYDDRYAYAIYVHFCLFKHSGIPTVDANLDFFQSGEQIQS